MSPTSLRRFAVLGLSLLGTLAAAAALQAAPAAAQSQQTFQDWEVVCNDKGICSAQHTASNNLARLVIGPNPERNALNMAFIVAKEAKPSSPAGLLIRGKGILPLQVRDCGPQYCFAVPPANIIGDVIEDLKAEREAIIAYQTEQQMVISPISLMGMSNALEALPK
ncbi:MAG: invasion associated locus B family protein [Rhodovibrionaceae bacterium]|nr:invasion associated locus B family protein [Rhodovibrionaceae bacterium]